MLIRQLSRRFVPPSLLTYANGPREDVVLLGRELFWHVAPRPVMEAWVERRLAVRPYFWLFILGLNNSGTTILARILERHPLIRSLPHEGQKIGDALPRADDVGLGRIWGTALDQFHWTEVDSPLPAVRAKFDWSRLYARHPGILLEKSPPNSVRTRWLQRNFQPSRFIALVRNPYAVCEGIRRRTGCEISVAAQHWASGNARMLEDLRSIDRWALVRYEDLCGDDRGVALRSISEFLDLTLPLDHCELDGISAHSIDGTTASIRNLNGKSIDRLSATDRRIVRSIAGPVMQQLGYDPI